MESGCEMPEHDKKSGIMVLCRTCDNLQGRHAHLGQHKPDTNLDEDESVKVTKIQ